MKVQMKVTFRTSRPIAQETGAKFWEHGSRFMATPGSGGKTYQLTTAGESGSVTEAVTAIGNTIHDIVENDGNNEATVIAIEAERE